MYYLISLYTTFFSQKRDFCSPSFCLHPVILAFLTLLIHPFLLGTFNMKKNSIFL